MDFYGFYTGTVLDAYTFLGAHLTDGGVVFRTFAPNARGVSLLWRGREIRMERVSDGNFYEAAVPEAQEGDCYEYRVYRSDTDFTDHCDPYGFQMELRPAHRSVVCNPGQYRFRDDVWMKRRGETAAAPMNIYELHLGSWRRRADGGWFRYEELAGPLAAYLKESGYNYVEFLPVSEHPSDESWGYQNTGFFAPTSRYGTPAGLKALIDTLHQNQIGVILDFVPVHFAVDAYALARYDGSALYEYPGSDVGSSEWGSYNFMHSRGEVRSFLQSAADFWLSEYHFDGLRVDAVSRLIYWQGDERRGVNGNAVDFLRGMNRALKARHPRCVLIAEDSTNYPHVTTPADQGGLGFDYKWDLGWMHDTLTYFQTPADERPAVYHKLTFSMLYFHDERYLLPLSHDEVVHGKAAILQKMSGSYEEKFAQARAMFLWMALHPGKKLHFMGAEIGQFREWDEKREQDWDLRRYPAHDSFYRYMTELNQLYLSHPALYERDYEAAGFRWLDCHQEGRCLYAVERTAGTERLAAVLNFSGAVQRDYEVPVGNAAGLTPLLYSDWEKYGGTTPETERVCHLRGRNLVCTMQPFSGILLAVRDQPGTVRP